MAQFIRFMRGETMEQAISNAQADLARGYSFAGYQCYETEDDALESDEVLYYGVDADTITEMPEGGYGFALDGLCGYEDDGREITDYPYADGYAFVARYEGRYVGQTDAEDGDVFRASALLSVEAIAAATIAA